MAEMENSGVVWECGPRDSHQPTWGQNPHRLSVCRWGSGGRPWDPAEQVAVGTRCGPLPLRELVEVTG